ncbi:pyruvate dehydrogenase E1 component [Dinoroseobacter shibae DFL 12 = DSM 16493]|jgi:pyruvate dehydrogenase E1 component|uniref:Pyruvate dehydrogenase E1 component n=1 Tax=Dinoroseobacter shibae (strain DSM 16493 / NCIMB 14021 / DFL 12) TaxID=398580 RepID=A8LP26_DINSH|nr:MULTISPECIES: pyruvate dehydrogenase (acetyl-transferring), homodimeric type [Dinoroseobacter]ABV93708.1 pyruvate dehydrogenase E1 component [Dinoroseobacter shibae DFL 12 = DSM 16493]MDD9715193.1 pyruvate dehydrogenase (acetyl-transferring), homodimeric type [Dinoroseobacter sp. PD6]URF45162.1 pyruvate dehydrogenase (acetyl-transferring), homodimeric type [Dinoroseobacter shibae]URF49467.1 pyruvate dehydrogenase (acetyl-transferring), homodimeric type [Dinoroseobacter shibae]
MTDTKHDIDPVESQEWQEAIEDVIARDGADRAHYLLDKAVQQARAAGATLPFSATTPYQNTIPADDQYDFPGDLEMEWRIRTINRWNAMATVVRRNKVSSEYGGHIASFASSAVMYDVGLNHFWRSKSAIHGGDLVFFQGHVIPGIYARSFMEGRISEEQLENFRSEVDGSGLSSYPHPWLMPDYWQFPTVSMGLGPLMAIYQARFMKYMHSRGLIDMADRKVWCFLGDGEMDEPESRGAIDLAVREGLDNLIFVINCNLQRLDGPVRGNGKIVQELEGDFRGAGWNVIKLLWGKGWDELLEKDVSGRLRQLMDETVDGDYQTFKSKDGAYIRKHFFGKYPETAALVEDWTDEQIWALRRGGHDPQKVYTAFKKATETKGQPSCLLVKTVKGHGMGTAGEGQNTTHQQKKMNEEQLRAFRDRFKIPVSDEDVGKAPFVALNNAQKAYILERRKELGGEFPKREWRDTPKLEIPALEAFGKELKSTGTREISTTMAFVRILTTLLRDKNIGKQVVPIVPDESRTFGMEGLFRSVGIYNPMGQTYIPEDRDQMSYYKESETGQVLQEGINEAGAMADWIAAATSYSNHGVPMIPFFIYYSMFGFQRIGDLAWAAGDSRARGFMLGGTAGRTTLNGEGLQHEDGHSHILAGTIPNCISYDPTFSYEVAVIVHHGLKRMYVEQDDVYFYLTLMNENYTHPDMPMGVEEDIIKGLYRFSKTAKPNKKHVNLMGSGTILVQAIKAAEMLKEDFGVTSDIWSATSMNELARDGQDCARANRLDPLGDQKVPFVTQQLEGVTGPVIAATDYMKNYAEQIRAFVPQDFTVLGTDGFGRSDSRVNLRRFFEVDSNHIAAAAMVALHRQGTVTDAVLKKALARYEIDSNKPNPRLV